MTFRILTFLMVFVGVFCQLAAAQPATKVNQTPNCFLPFNLTANGSSDNLDNRASVCNVWAVVYEIFGGTGSGSVLFEASVSNSSGGTTTLSYAAFPSTGVTNPVVGTNPSTATFASVWFVGGAPNVRVTVSGLNGTLRGTIWGWSANSSATGGGSSTVTVNVNNQVCFQNATSTLAVSFSALNGSQQLVAPSGSTRVYVCHISISWDNTANVKLITGTGATCGTGTANLTGAYTNATYLALDEQFRTPASVGLCLNTSAAVTGGGLLIYVQQ